MKIFKKYWKALLALVLIAAAAFIYLKVYEDEKAAYEAEKQQLETFITALQSAIQENMFYEDVQDDINAAREEMDASRLALYKHFPKELKQEDQIMYVLYLEKLFGTEIFFQFSDEPQLLVPLSDGSGLNYLILSVNYETTYKGFKDMVNYLATDSRITSVQSAQIQYDQQTDKVVGILDLVLYVMDSELLEYEAPDVGQSEQGNENIFG